MNAAKKMELRNDSLFELIENKLKEIKTEYKSESQKNDHIDLISECIKCLEEQKISISNTPIKKLPESWEELDIIGGWYTSAGNGVFENKENLPSEKDDFETKKQALSSLAYAQLTRLLKAYNGDWTPDFTCGKTKYCIYRSASHLHIETYSSMHFFLTLETREKAEHFLKHHEALIKQFYQM